MNTRIPDDAFDFYVSLGADRTYEAVAAHFGVSHSGIKKAARRENWQERIADIEAEVQGRLNKRFADEAEEMRDRHLKTVRAMMGRALKGIQQFPLANGMEAIRAAELTIRLERLIMGEVSERTEVRAEDVIRQEMKRWLVPVGTEVDFAEEFEADGEDDVAGASGSNALSAVSTAIGGSDPKAASVGRAGNTSIVGSVQHVGSDAARPKVIRVIKPASAPDADASVSGSSQTGGA